MDNRKNTLRSQTVRCPHCGEYYSVTYKYCPFCDAGRQEEERRQAEKKQKKQAFLSNLFGGGEGEKKKRSEAPASGEGGRSSRERSAKEPAAKNRTERTHSEHTRSERTAHSTERTHTTKEHGTRESARSTKEHTAKEHTAHTAKEHTTKEHAAKEHAPKEAAPKKDLFRRHGPRKKTSEMTPEERAASLAEREARAAARKRERDRLAREAALAALEATPEQEKADEAPTETEQLPPVEAGPVFDADTVPETFGFAEPMPTDVETAVFVQGAAGGENPVEVSGNEGTPETPAAATVPPAPAATAPVATAAPETPQEASPAQPAGQTEGTPAPVPPAATPAAPAEETPWAELKDLAPAPETVAPVQAPAAPTEQAVPGQVPVVQTPPVPEDGDDLDALLSEIRDLLAESPVPQLRADQIEKPAAPVQEVQLQEDGEPAEQPAQEEAAPAEETPAQEPQEQPEEAPAENEDSAAQPEEEAQEDLPPVDEPTIPLGDLAAAQAEWQASQEGEREETAVDDQPTQVISRQEIQEELQAQTENGWSEEELAPAVRPPRPSKPARTEKKERRRTGKKTKKGGPNLVLILVSLAIVVAAAFIVVRTVVPAFQSGILSGSSKAAESVTLDRESLDLAEAGTTMTLTAVFAPEGSTAKLTWTSSDPAIATVDEAGTVTAVAPGTTVITATMENGQQASCTVNCTWTAEGGEAAGGEAPAGEEGTQGEEEAPAEPALSTNDITLDSEGATQQITITGTEEQPTWSSSDTSVATVSSDGTVTAVAPGRATVTATVGDKTFNCAVRCIW